MKPQLAGLALHTRPVGLEARPLHAEGGELGRCPMVWKLGSCMGVAALGHLRLRRILLREHGGLLL